jgi:spore germination protein GerM
MLAMRRAAKKTQSKGSQAIVIFWLVFVIGLIVVFMVNAETIQRNFDVFRTRMTAPQGAEEEILAFEEEEPQVTVIIEPAPLPVTQQIPQAEPERPAAPSVTQPATQQQTQPPPPPPPAQLRERAIYFTHVGADGQILQSRVVRRLPVSETPMQDALNIMLTGPSTDEVGRGILNLIPANTRILAATVRGSTAYISFSEDFLFNTFGVEGYVAQLRQIVWTVTEFPNVRDVQILIEGRRMDFLGEGIWIGSPISRQSF